MITRTRHAASGATRVSSERISSGVSRAPLASVKDSSNVPPYVCTTNPSGAPSSATDASKSRTSRRNPTPAFAVCVKRSRRSRPRRLRSTWAARTRSHEQPPCVTVQRRASIGPRSSVATNAPIDAFVCRDVSNPAACARARKVASTLDAIAAVTNQHTVRSLSRRAQSRRPALTARRDVTTPGTARHGRSTKLAARCAGSCMSRTSPVAWTATAVLGGWRCRGPAAATPIAGAGCSRRRAVTSTTASTKRAATNTGCRDRTETARTSCMAAPFTSTTMRGSNTGRRFVSSPIGWQRLRTERDHRRERRERHVGTSGRVCGFNA